MLKYWNWWQTWELNGKGSGKPYLIADSDLHNESVDNTPDDSNEVKRIPRVFEKVLNSWRVFWFVEKIK